MSENTNAADLVAKLKRQTWIPVGVFTVLVISCWGVYLLAALAGVDMLHRNVPPSDSTCNIYLVISIIATLVAIPIVIKAVLKISRLAKYGAWTRATVAGISAIRKNGIGPVTFEYQVANQRYRVTRDVHVSTANISVGSSVNVVYDPNSPNACEILAYS